MSENDRPRGVLTDRDLEFLRFGYEYAQGSTTRNRRRCIRERTRSAIQDFAILFTYLEHRDRVQVLDEFARRYDEVLREIEGEERSEGDPELVWEYIANPASVPQPIATGGLRQMQAFICLLLYDALVDEVNATEHQFTAALSELVRQALADAYGKHDEVVDIRVDIDVSHPDVTVDELRERFEEGYDKVDELDVERLVNLRAISWDEYMDYLEATRE